MFICQLTAPSNQLQIRFLKLQSHKTNSIWKHDKHTSSICLVLTLACSSSFMTVARSFSVRCFSSWRTFSSSRASLTSSVSWSSSDPAPASSRALESSVNKLKKKKEKLKQNSERESGFWYAGYWFFFKEITNYNQINECLFVIHYSIFQWNVKRKR